MPSADVASLRIADEHTEWAVKEVRESGDVYWDTLTTRADVERDLAWFQRKYPNQTFRVVSHRVIVTEWSETE